MFKRYIFISPLSMWFITANGKFESLEDGETIVVFFLLCEHETLSIFTVHFLNVSPLFSRFDVLQNLPNYYG